MPFVPCGRELRDAGTVGEGLRDGTQARPSGDADADDAADVEGVAAFAAGLGGVSRMDILPFHKLGEAKWQALAKPFTLHDTPSPTAEQVAAPARCSRPTGCAPSERRVTPVAGKTGLNRSYSFTVAA
ncbi:hypothetical protein ACF07V_26800 [Streptomyces sp. NPDC015661]|uniref:hypothetical protein n=1 Tax=Streptomyces sp. NPDC015661 TaxID=3364961 RepID=UPI0036F9503B